MVWLNWHQKAEQQLLNPASLREPFHILTITLLSLLLPLSFLLLSRLTCAHHLLSCLEYSNPSQISSFLLSFVLYTNPSALYLLVSILSLATFIHGLTGKVIFLRELSPGPVLHSHLYTAWIFVCTLQVFVGLGIEGTIAGGIEASNIGMKRSLFSKVIFFLGLHETMLHWSRVVVRPVVDDTIFGVIRKEKWVEKVVMAVSFGTLWWWKLRDEVEAMVVVGEFKRELLMSRRVDDFVAWWLYYLTVTIGMIRVVKGFMSIGRLLLCRRRVVGNSADSKGDVDNKV